MIERLDFGVREVSLALEHFRLVACGGKSNRKPRGSCVVTGGFGAGIGFMRAELAGLVLT